MKTGRIFVIAVMVLGTVACHSSRKSSPTAERDALVKEGEQKVQDTLTLETELAEQFQIGLEMDPGLLAQIHGTTFNHIAQSYNWNHLNLEGRRVVKRKLATLVAEFSRVLEIGTHKGIYIEQRDLIERHRENALLFERSLESYEKAVGVNYEPKGDRSNAPIYNKLQDARKGRSAKIKKV